MFKTGKPGFSLHIEKGNADGGSSQKDESVFEFVQPSKIVFITHFPYSLEVLNYLS